MTAGARNPTWSQQNAARRVIEASDVAYAQARWPRQGWQTIARQLGVNAADLQRLCEDQSAAVQQATTARPAPGMTLRPGSAMAKILLAIASGARSAAAAALDADVRDETCRSYLPKLKAAGLIGERNDSGWPLTAAGKAELAALKAADHG